MTRDDFEWEETEAKMLRNVDKKKRKLEKKMQELEDELSNQQSYARQLERDYQKTYNTKDQGWQWPTTAGRLMDAKEVIDRTQDKLRRVRKEYDDLDHQQTRYLNNAPDAYLLRKDVAPLAKAIKRNEERMYEIRHTQPPFTGTSYRKLPEYRTLKRSTFYLNIDKTETEQKLLKAEKEKEESGRALERYRRK
jgi:hypothetical protein